MDELNTEVNKIATTQDAIAVLLGEPFIEWAHEHVLGQVKLWLSPKESAPDKVRKFLAQRFLIEQAFWSASEGDPGFLGFAIANLSESNDPEAESALEILEKFETETMSNNQILAGWQGTLKSVEIPSEELARIKPKEPVRSFIAELSDIFSNSEWQEALGAFMSLIWTATGETEFINFLIRQSGGHSLALTDSRPAEFAHLLDKVVLNQQDKDLVWRGIQRQLQAYEELTTQLQKYLN